jgi:hypothetical protein
MKKLILILALFLFTFTLESSTIEENSPMQGDKILILHNTGNGFIEIEISIDALESHLAHGDYVDCLPPCQPPR